MSIKLIMLIILILSGLEIFSNLITMLINSGIRILIKDFRFNKKITEIIKVIFVIAFMLSVIFLLVQFVKVMALWFGISLDKSILDIFR
ncbi:hypothetical protein SAMN05660462_03057 [Proteiniborus ethanoligenes]|uniref:Uncharacterized protein n=2 Tax=Proteiniborus ethanoligenes TaxID=415015 RepID=A0A1H3SSJ9_9FIRM|nr:hypothetical protein SAMN05660462_03057 [Proteiniborus ethanoligenes]